MAILDLQRRGQQIGRIRIGEQVAVIKDGKDTGKTRPVRRETFRLTTGSRHQAEAIAELLGGTPRPWNGEWEVPTNAAEINVMVPPRDQVISQHYEMWTAGGCQRRCNSQYEGISGGPCKCPHAEDPDDAEEVERAALQRARLAKQQVPQACSLVTRLNVMIPDLPGLGVFRLDTGSYYAAVEIGDAAALLQRARDQGVFLPAVLRIDHRQRVAGGQTKKFPVPVLEILATFRQIAGGELEAAGIAAQLPPAPGAQWKALTAGTPAREAAVPDLSMIDDREPLTAQQVADLAATARDRAALKAVIDRAKADGVEDDMVLVDPERPDHYIVLRVWLTAVWKHGPDKAREAVRGE